MKRRRHQTSSKSRQQHHETQEGERTPMMGKLQDLREYSVITSHQLGRMSTDAQTPSCLHFVPLASDLTYGPFLSPNQGTSLLNASTVSESLKFGKANQWGTLESSPATIVTPSVGLCSVPVGPIWSSASKEIEKHSFKTTFGLSLPEHYVMPKMQYEKVAQQQKLKATAKAVEKDNVSKKKNAVPIISIRQPENVGAENDPKQKRVKRKTKSIKNVD